MHDMKCDRTPHSHARSHSIASFAMRALIDVGANLCDERFRGIYHDRARHASDLEFVLARARDARVERIIITCGSLGEAKEGLKLAREMSSSSSSSSSKRAPALSTTVGVHPTRCDEFGSDARSVDAHVGELLALARDGMRDGVVVAIGECGLDYVRDEFCSRAVQREMFERQFALAEATSLPMFLHMRGAASDFIEILSRNRHRFTKCVVHSFDGTADEAKAILAIAEGRVFIGINGCSLRSSANVDVARSIPLSRVVLETDSPWCSIKPSHASYDAIDLPREIFTKPRRYDAYVSGAIVKDRNEPAFALAVAQCVARAKGIDLDVVCDVTSANARAVFWPRDVSETT